MEHQQENAKKKKFKRTLIKILYVVLGAILLGLLLESRRTPLSAEEFTFRMEEAGFIVEDKTSSFEKARVYLVVDHGALHIEFMVYETMAEARTAFREFRSDLEDLGEVIVFYWTSSGFNSWYEQNTTDGQYARMNRIRNTVILISTTTEYITDVEEIWDMLGQ